jgi:hypothetical protein
MKNTCNCGHALEEHGGDPAFPGATNCNVEECDCFAYELAEKEDDEDEDDEGLGEDPIGFDDDDDEIPHPSADEGGE